MTPTYFCGLSSDVGNALIADADEQLVPDVLKQARVSKRKEGSTDPATPAMMLFWTVHALSRFSDDEELHHANTHPNELSSHHYRHSLQIAVNSTPNDRTDSTKTALPSDRATSDSPTFASNTLVNNSDSIVRHSRRLLSVLYLLITRPRPTSFPWNNRPSQLSESEVDASFQPPPRFIDENEKFNISLFDEADVVQIVASLRRCRAVDLSDVLLFDEACYFMERIITSDVVSMSFRWKLDYLLSFEKRHQMMSRLSSDPSPSSIQVRSKHYLSPLAITFGSLLSIFRGCDYPSALKELITVDFDSSPHNMSDQLNPAFFLNHTSHTPKRRLSFFPMDLMFERYLRNDPESLLRGWVDVSDCTPRKFLLAPFVGLHSLLLRCPKLNLHETALRHLMSMFIVNASGQDTTQANILNLFNCYPPPRLLDTLLSHPPLLGTSFIIRMFLLTSFVSFGVFTAPFGACSSLAQVFKILTPFNQNPTQYELSWLSGVVGEGVVSLHWLSIPAHFDSPLLCHLPSLAGAQRGVLQTLSSHSGIPSLVAPLTTESFTTSITSHSRQNLPSGEFVRLLALTVHFMQSDDFHSSANKYTLLRPLTPFLLSPIPAVVSAAFEFIHRFVSVSSDAVRIELVKRGLLDHVVFAVSNSSFLDDYEKGVAVIGILLDTIRRDHLKNEMTFFDFDHY
ncbi:hypothetical protein BLNAU_17049 [Blattamonas nauphoetae]|uniref:Uncharacterized protein n=1 Tax=Blattamonas nauphoetae TaxID=2049346 RepID=A0ABQ9X7Y9_9EUKA|nr:hypothetical protein BLNAU_17049 [Blattamonas nauphoetae]